MKQNAQHVELLKRDALREPEFVMERLFDHRAILNQDVESLRMVWPICVSEAAKRGQETVAYLRSKLLIPIMAGKSQPTDATPAAWHPFILEYCRTLGVVGDAVGRLYQRIVSGDVTDKRAVETEADDAFAQLDAAHAEARAQWKAGGAVIKSPKVRKRIEQLSEIESEAAEQQPQKQRKRNPKWSNSRSPSDWLKVFAKLNVDCRSLSVFGRRRKDGTFRQHPASKTKSVRLALADLPPDYSDNMTA